MPATLEEGQPAPDVSALTDKGETVSLTDFPGKRVVVYFYPKDDTPGCTIEACDFRDHIAAIETEDAVVLGVSLDDVASHEQFRDKFELPFTLLADTDHAVSEAFGVYGKQQFRDVEYMGVTRATFIIAKDGTIAKVWPQVNPNGHGEDVLAWLREHKG